MCDRASRDGRCCKEKESREGQAEREIGWSGRVSLKTGYRSRDLNEVTGHRPAPAGRCSRQRGAGGCHALWWLEREEQREPG